MGGVGWGFATAAPGKRRLLHEGTEGGAVELGAAAVAGPVGGALRGGDDGGVLAGG